MSTNNNGKDDAAEREDPEVDDELSDASDDEDDSSYTYTYTSGEYSKSDKKAEPKSKNMMDGLMSSFKEILPMILICCLLRKVMQRNYLSRFLSCLFGSAQQAPQENSNGCCNCCIVPCCMEQCN
ncbi:unnamed protein product [Protopolystoma xenopodis]|uniref:Uncharacterized protein n=1 Tax=Protopolystoma xenopodis TaxID=117903 RepID=A0A448WFR8_9PLAT|nr:unnamed protein product [Protopolystoma xenopodis]